MKNNNPRPVAQRCEVFQNVFDILLFAGHATKPFTSHDIQECVMDASINTIQNYLADLKERGYIEKDSNRTYVATQFTKDLLNVEGKIKP
ncbi:hypothetical protein D7V21_05145 [Acinetobacter guerrae]|uniref:LexA repressor DNA-binding domain-containing protein n=1 Tax=Acinetobacter guerrae TaxID=1843371 RepID=A0A3A8EM10_9GAMM|nr:hypothetical protein [Acinetobacter guerrae]RKG35169.1 hypothetical protein D7V21_05145 [Acinetobacter guerrae]